MKQICARRLPCAALSTLATLAALAFIIQPTYANGGPPPRRIWLVFGQGSAPTAAQIIGCSDAACTQINLLREYGRCESAECIDTPQALTSPTDYFDCADGRCLFSTYADMPPYIKLVAQFPDGDRSSAALPIDQNAKWSMGAFRVVNAGQNLQITPATDIPNEQLGVGRMSQTYNWLLPSGLLTMAVELLVIALLLYMVVKVPMPALPGWLAIVAITNLLSYPATWLFFPNLSYWSTSSERGMGVLAVLFAIAMAGWLIAIRYVRRRGLKVTLSIIAGVVLVLGCLGSVPLLMVVGYGQVTPGPANGIPFQAMLVLAEAFAVVFETLVIYGLSKRQLRLPLTFFLVLAANAASFGAGLLLYSPYVFRV